MTFIRSLIRRETDIPVYPEQTIFRLQPGYLGIE